MPLPDGLTSEDLAHLDLETLRQVHPEKAMIMADFALKQQVSNAREAWAHMARIVYYVEKYELWKYHPDGYSSFNAWCQQPEIELPPSVSSDMLAVCKFAPVVLEETGTDLFELIAQVGQSKVRQVVPLIRKAWREKRLKEDLTPVLDELGGASFRDIMRMLSPSGQRLVFDPEVIYEENPDGSFNLILRNLDYDRVELASVKLGIKRWFDTQGYRIPNPLDQLEAGEE
jgi:hypothetical protein